MRPRGANRRPRDQPNANWIYDYILQPPAGYSRCCDGFATRPPEPSRISATLLCSLVLRLEERACFEGRSLSNLIAHILEGAA